MVIDTLTVASFVVCSSNGGSKTSPALCQWSEVMNHPGLVCCVQQTTGVPLVVMVKPDTFLIQEIKTLPAKAKVSARFSHSLLCCEPSLFLYLFIHFTSPALSVEAHKRSSVLFLLDAFSLPPFCTAPQLTVKPVASLPLFLCGCWSVGVGTMTLLCPLLLDPRHGCH